MKVRLDGVEVVSQFRLRPLGTKTVTPPTQNNWETILDTINDVLIDYLSVIHDNTGASNGNVEIRVTVDGSTYTGSIVAWSANQIRYWSVDPLSDALDHDTARTPFGVDGGVYTHAFKAEMRMTSAPGAGATMTGKCRYQSLV